MSAAYPSGVYSPRTKANKSGVVYTPSKSTITYAEDVQGLDAEVVAIETELGANPKGGSASVAARFTTDESAISGKQAALGFTPEDVSNKKTTLSDNSDTYYPSQKAVKTAVDAKFDKAGGTFSAAIADKVSALSDGATPALDASLGNIFTLSAAGNRTIAVPSNPATGQKIIIRHYASGGARTLALNTGAGGFRFGSDIAALTETVSGKTDYIGCVWNDAASFWDVVAYIKGF